MNELVAIDDAALDGIVGGNDATAPGPNVTTVTTGDQSVSTSRTNYGHCVDSVRQACDRANPGWFGFGTDQRGAAQCTLRNVPTCNGAPPG